MFHTCDSGMPSNYRRHGREVRNIGTYRRYKRYRRYRRYNGTDIFDVLAPFSRCTDHHFTSLHFLNPTSFHFASHLHTHTHTNTQTHTKDHYRNTHVQSESLINLRTAVRTLLPARLLRSVLKRSAALTHTHMQNPPIGQATSCLAHFSWFHPTEGTCLSCRDTHLQTIAAREIVRARVRRHGSTDAQSPVPITTPVPRNMHRHATPAMHHG